MCRDSRAKRNKEGIKPPVKSAVVVRERSHNPHLMEWRLTSIRRAYYQRFAVSPAIDLLKQSFASLALDPIGNDKTRFSEVLACNHSCSIGGGREAAAAQHNGRFNLYSIRVTFSFLFPFFSERHRASSPIPRRCIAKHVSFRGLWIAAPPSRVLAGREQDRFAGLRMFPVIALLCSCLSMTSSFEICFRCPFSLMGIKDLDSFINIGGSLQLSWGGLWGFQRCPSGTDCSWEASHNRLHRLFSSCSRSTVSLRIFPAVECFASFYMDCIELRLPLPSTNDGVDVERIKL